MDDAIAATEAQDLFAVVPNWAAASPRVLAVRLQPWTAEAAEAAFLDLFRALRRRRPVHAV
jgi:hypothetical protein